MAEALMVRAIHQADPVLRRTCLHCLCRRGQHRWRDEACPNPDWQPGNGKPQWLPNTEFSWDTKK